jgi:hypothetical protein
MTLADREAREQVQKLIDSDVFRTSETHRRLLRYLAEKSLSGEADQLKEYTVGMEAVGKPPSYNPQVDSTVRLQIARLRERIIEYYRTVGQADPIRIEFPKGHFKLIFRRCDPTPQTAAAVKKWRWLAFSAMVATGLMAGLYIRLAVSLRAGNPPFPLALEQFWAPLMADRKPALICIGAPMFLYSPGMGLYRDSRVNTWEAAQGTGLVSRMQRAFPLAKEIRPWYPFTGLGEAEGAAALTRLLLPKMPGLRITNSSTMSWDEIRDNNVIFVGAPKFNLQINDLPVQQELLSDPGGDIRNIHPRPGEPAYFEDSVDQNDNGTVYALITRMPGLHGEGLILVLAGQGNADTLAAAQYVTSNGYLTDLMSHLAPTPSQAPSYYQVVIRAKVKRDVPVELSYVLHRILPVSHTRRHVE